MNRTTRCVIAGALSAVAIAVLMTPIAAGQVKKGKERAITTEQLMEGLVAPNCGQLKKALEAGPTDDKAWKEIAIKAALLNEAGYLLMDDGRCPDGDWAGATKTLRECSAAVLAAVEAKDAEAGMTAFTAMTKACGACHKAHKKD
jgi:hypothetical protein